MARGMRINFGQKGYILEARCGHFYYDGAAAQMPPRIVAGQVLPAALVGSAYQYTFAVVGGVGPYTIQIVSVSPDTGNWLAAQSGTKIGGTPVSAETETITVRAIDSHGVASAQATFSLLVNPNNVTTGTIYHTEIVTIPAPGGTGFGAKSRGLSPLLDDWGQDGAGAINPGYSATAPAWAYVGWTQNNLVNQPIGFSPTGAQIGVPHPFVAGFLAGCHYNGQPNTTDSANVYAAWGLAAIPNLPFTVKFSWYETSDDNWSPTSGSGTNDHARQKVAWGPAAGPASNCTVLQFTNPGPLPTVATQAVQLVNNSAGNPIQGSDANGHGTTWAADANPTYQKNSWIFHELEITFDDRTWQAAGAGKVNYWVNGKLIVSYVGQTYDDAWGGAGSPLNFTFGPGIFVRDYGPGSTNNTAAQANFEYIADTTADATADGVSGHVAELSFHDQPTWAASTIRSPGRVQAWSDASVTVEFRQDRFVVGQKAYCSALTEAGAVLDGFASFTVVAQPGLGFDYYIGPNGKDTNAGTVLAPWAITSLQDTNPNNLLIASKRVGLLPGTHNVAGMTSGSNPSDPKRPILNLPPGTFSNPTYLGTCDSSGNYSPRTATILVGGGAITNAVLGSNPINAGNFYVTIDGVDINGGNVGGTVQASGQFGAHLIAFNAPGTASVAGTAQGVLVENCELYGIQASDLNGDDCAVFLVGCNGATVQNCYLHDVQKPSQPAFAHGILDYSCQNNRYIYNSVMNCSAGVESKQGSGGTEIGFNYFFNCPAGAVTGCDGASGNPNKPGTPYHVHHNVVDSCGPAKSNDINTNALMQGVDTWNNTIWDERSGTVNLLDLRSTNSVVQSWNNIFQTTTASGGAAQGAVAFSAGHLGIVDYNCFAYVSATGGWGLSNGGAITLYNTLGTWQIGAPGADVHSVTTTPTYVGQAAVPGGILPGGGPSQFAIQPGTALSQTGRLGYDFGAWGGLDDDGNPVGQIGASFVIYPTEGALTAPQQLWSGFVDSTHILVMCWPTSSGGENGYNFYLNGAKVNTTPVLPATNLGGGSVAQPYIVIAGLTPNTSYTITAKAVFSGSEGPASNALTIKTDLGATSGTGSTPSTPPTAATDPSTWVVLPPAAAALASVPSGNTLWLASNTGNNNAAGTSGANPGGGTTQTACGLAYALAHLNLAGGDVIILTANATYQGSFSLPTTTGAKPTYIASSQSPEYNASGTLVGYSVVAADSELTGFTLTGNLAAAATTGTLNAAFTGRTGYYPTVFTPQAAGALQESRYVLFTHGSTALTWRVALTLAATTAIAAHIGNYVTPSDLPGGAIASMPSVQFDSATNGGIGWQTLLAKNFRFIGVGFQPVSSVAAQMYYCVESNFTATPNDSLYFDRCLFGTDTADYLSTMSYVRHGLALNCNHALVHQCWFYGLVDGSNGGGLPGSDANAIMIEGGGPVAIRNCMIEAQAEGVITGGQTIFQTNIPHDVVSQWNLYHKPTQWQANGIGTGVKNHLEHKCVQRALSQGDYFLNNWYAFASQGQHGRAIVAGARDQTAGWGPQNGPTATIVSIVGSTITYSSSTGSALFGVGGYVWLSGAGGITPVMLKISGIGSSGPNFTVTVAQTLVGTYTSGGTLAMTGNNKNPWNVVTDFKIQDAKAMNVGALLYAFTGDSSATAYTARVQLENSFALGNPGTDTHGTQTEPRLVHFSGAVSNLIVDHVTALANPNSPNFTNFAFSSGLFYEGSQFGVPADRATVSNSVLDGNYMVNNGSQVSGLTALNQCFSNLTWIDNLPVLDATSYAGAGINGNVIGATYAHTAPGSIGFAAYVSEALIPVPASNLNITTGPFSTGSTTGGPIGSIFQTSGPLATGLAAAPRPLVHGEFVSPNAGAYASGANTANYALFNSFAWNAYMGIEHDMGTSMNAAMTAIKNYAATHYGITSYPLIYVMSSETALTGFPPGSTPRGSGDTYTQWCGTAGAVALANWWLRTSYPTGTIVQQDQNSGNVNVSVNDATLDSGGRTVWQGFARHYDGVLRQGQAVALGYTSGQAFAVNTALAGYDFDNVFCIPRQSGAWANTTTNYPPNAQTAAWLQQGAAKQIAAMRASFPGALIFINSDFFVHSTGVFGTKVALDPSMIGVADIVFCEGVAGDSFAIDGHNGATFAQLMAAIIPCEQMLTPSGVVLLAIQGPSKTSGWSSNSQAAWTPADWRGLRAFFCAAHLRNWEFGANIGAYPATSWVLHDEMGQPAIGNRTYFGAPPGAEPPQSGPRAKGCWWRVWPGNGTYLQVVVIVVPREATVPLTLNLQTDMGLAGTWQRLANGSTSTGDPAVNTGAVVSSVTFNTAHDGLVLVRTA